MPNSNDLTTGNVRSKLYRLAWPIMIGMLLHTAYNIIDTIFVGMLGPESLAAVSITFPVVFIFIAIASGLSVGGTTVVAQAVGARNMQRAGNAAEHALVLAIIAGFLIAVFGFLFAPSIFQFMGATPEIIGLTISYINLIFIGFVFLFVGFIAQGIIQAEGNSKTPMKFMLISVALNIVLDPLLMFGMFGLPAMGVTGAGLATVIARGIGALLPVGYLLFGYARVKLSMCCFKWNSEILKRILYIGMPASASNSITSIGMVFLMSIVGGFGTAAIAAFGVGLRVDSIAIMPIVGISSATLAMVGQNIGAKEKDRVINTVRVAMQTITLLMLPITAFMVLFPHPFFAIFTSSPEIIAIGASYLSIFAFSYVFKGNDMVLKASFQGAGKSLLAMGIMVVQWFSMVSLAFLLSGMVGLSGVWIGMLLGTLISFFISIILFIRKQWLKDAIKDVV